MAGFALFVAGGSDFLIAWFPSRFGNPEWEFGTVTAALNAMPAPLLGLTLMLVAAIEREFTGVTRLLATVALAWAVGLLLAGVIYGLTLPLAAKGFAVPNIGLGLKRAILKTLVQLVTYPVVLVWMGVRGWKLARS